MRTNVQTSFNELISGMTVSGWYDNLKIVLSKNCSRSIGQEYLMVTRTAFGVVRLLNLEFVEDRIRMDFQCASTGEIKPIFLDVEDQGFRFLLISWHDLKKMAMEKRIQDDKLLEFDF